MKKVFIDTNVVMAIMELKIDPFAQLPEVLDFPFRVYILEGSVKELEQLQQHQKGKFRRAAKLGLRILQAKKISIIKEEGMVDDLLARHSQRGDVILTQDRELKRRLTKPYLTIRQKKRIIMVK